MSYKGRGFTLIEIMVVMAVVSLLISFVGPLTLNAIDKSERKSETQQLKRLLKKAGYLSFIRQNHLTVKLTGSDVSIADSFSKEQWHQSSFEHLVFTEQTLQINENGFIAPSTVTLSYDGGSLTIELDAYVNGFTTVVL